MVEFKKHMEILKCQLYEGKAGISTCRLAKGTIKGLCSNRLGASGKDIDSYWKIWWSPVFSLASVWDNFFLLS